MEERELCNLSLRDLSGLLRSRKLSSREATQVVLGRIRRLNPHLRAYITVMEDSALTAAERADKSAAAGQWRGPLHGIPVAVKDLCWTRGVRTTCSSSVLRDWRPDSDATVVTRLENAGAVILGKLNLTEFAMAWYGPEFLTPLNPWNEKWWPGGSSSGSGVATAAGLCFGSIGTDTGGSIRFPTAANGIVGLKPTWGRVSRYGVFPLGESLDHIGPMTRTVGDAAIMLGAIAGHDPADETSLEAPIDDYTAAIDQGVSGIRIGIDEKYLGESPADVSSPVLDAVRAIEKLGARIVKVKVPETDAALAAWTTLCSAEARAAHVEFYPQRAADYGVGYRSFLELGSKVSGADYANAHMVRERFSNRFNALFDKMDALACPSMPFRAIPIDSIPPDASGFLGPNPLMRYTGPFNMSRNPTLSLPCGPAVDGPPASLQLVGCHLGEATLIAIGSAYQAATEWHRQHPDCG